MSKRDYNKEYQDNTARKYSYDFDTILRRYMMEAVRPFISDYSSPALEMGCFKGDFTELLEKDFKNLTVIEASDELVQFTRDRVGGSVKFITSTFEEYEGNNQYDYIFLIHTLEHLDDPVAVLRKTKQWLSSSGKLFLICPNANAPSRQIAVKMGLISHNSAVTPAEKEHGHRITYTLDTLERDAKAAGLKVVYRSGIFFKALANFQWDKLLNTDIISKEYLDGCYDLGQEYPDLCSSIFLLCEKGK